MGGRRKAAEKASACLCCRHRTFAERGDGYICPVCFWQDDGDALDRPSAANGGLTLAQARRNYAAFGACEERFRDVGSEGRFRDIGSEGR
ncbi:CPCC family cysteine-rich protein [Allorhizocola rhizosphaerae]|uniref:CPCC family cysteine-rich protein n=1 Tax=Allorhizocola rhizosphaerae TaxID=1872709 RepID=UPI000E3BEC54|nr:CPCC family cysteine-rich protein [Allorhizocola rhizosphaerae]